MSKKLVIYGTGETALLAHDYFVHDSDYEVVAFTVDAAYKTEEVVDGLPVVDFEKIEELYPKDQVEMFVASASGQLNRVRTFMFDKARQKGYRLASYISSKAFVWHNVKIGENCFILENNVLQPFTEVEDNVVMWSGNHLGHRSVVRRNCFITSHVVISGYCDIGESSFVGVNACFADGVKVAKDNFIGMGTVVNKNTVENSLYVGNPAQRRDTPALAFCKVKIGA